MTKCFLHQCVNLNDYEHAFFSIIDFAYFQLRFDALSCSEVSYPKCHNIITLECL